MKHKNPYVGNTHELPDHLPIEAQIVDIADEISYTSHDLDDGIDSRFLHPEVIHEVPLWQEAREQITEQFPMDENVPVFN